MKADAECGGLPETEMKRILFLSIAIILAIGADAQPKFRRAKKQETQKVLIEAVYSPLDGQEVVMHKGYNVSYNPRLMMPNWVAYELTAEEASSKDFSTKDQLIKDPDIKGTQASAQNYAGASFAYGRMAAAADMRWDKEALQESLYLSNTCPQNRDLNAGLWYDLEKYCRAWAQRYGRIWIVCGPVFFDGKTSTAEKLAEPDMFFKCVCAKIGDRWSMAAFMFPNMECKGDLTTYMFPVVAAEAVTKCEFFNNIGLQDPLKTYEIKNLHTASDWVIPNTK